MIERRESIGASRLRVVAERAPDVEEAIALVRSLGEDPGTRGELVDFGGGSAYLKAEPLMGRARARHALRGLLMRRPLPRLAEYENLLWLRTRLFEAVEPLAAGRLSKGGMARWQFLVTRRVVGVRTLRELLEEGEEDPGPVLEELAREVARMHALHFVHRDLFPRNVLVRGSARPRRVVFLDAWRGGARVQLRGAAYDLGCLFLWVPEWLSTERQREFLERYLEQRAVQGKAVERGELIRRVKRERAALRRRLERRVGLGSGRELPAVEWEV